MVNKKDKTQFAPNVAIPPGETIRENMAYLGMNQIELAARLDLTTKHLSNIINGNAPITYDTALKLESTIGPSAQFWMNLETNYQLNKARLEEEEKLELELALDSEILKEIPYKAMSDLGWVEVTRKRAERVFNCREFFGVARLSAITNSHAVAFRTHKQVNKVSEYGVLAWLRKAELEGLNMEVDKLNKRKLKKLIPTFRELTLKEPVEFYPEMKRLCAECGVALVLVPYLPRTDICGATMWRKEKAILALSDKGKQADTFWFTFFHELAHLINHSNNDLHISYENEADDLASNYFISEEQYKVFIDKYNYRDKRQIINYAHEIGIAPFILLGRLQHNKLIGYQHYKDLIPPFEIAVN